MVGIIVKRMDNSFRNCGAGAWVFPGSASLKPLAIRTRDISKIAQSGHDYLRQIAAARKGQSKAIDFLKTWQGQIPGESLRLEKMPGDVFELAVAVGVHSPFKIELVKCAAPEQILAEPATPAAETIRIYYSPIFFPFVKINLKGMPPTKKLATLAARLEEYPGHPVLRHYRAAALIELDRLIEAETDYRELVSGFPNNLGMKNCLAGVLVRLKKLEEAETFFYQTLAMAQRETAAEDVMFARNGIAGIRIRQSRIEEAMEMYEETYRDFPRDPIAPVALASLLVQKKMLNRAEGILNAVLKRVPCNRQAMSILSDITLARQSR